MRLDPDVIMCGEIRNLESAEICAQAALTGHLVMTTLHTLDAVGAIQRLRDIGLLPYIVGATLVGAIAQRLVRRVCPDCREEEDLDARDPIARALDITAEDLASHKVYAGRGCERCHQAGYRGRAAIYEVLTMDRELAAMVGNGDSVAQIAEAARAKGFRTMRDDARRKVLDGLTSTREVVRVLA